MCRLDLGNTRLGKVEHIINRCAQRGFAYQIGTYDEGTWQEAPDNVIELIRQRDTLSAHARGLGVPGGHTAVSPAGLPPPIDVPDTRVVDNGVGRLLRLRLPGVPHDRLVLRGSRADIPLIRSDDDWFVSKVVVLHAGRYALHTWSHAAGAEPFAGYVVTINGELTPLALKVAGGLVRGVAKVIVSAPQHADFVRAYNVTLADVTPTLVQPDLNLR